MKLPAELISTASVSTAPTGHLLLALDRARALLWIREAGDFRFAVFLTGEHGGRAFEIRADSGGSGVAIGPVQVRVDAASVSSESSAWSLRAREGSLSLPFEAERLGGFPERLWSPVADCKTTADDVAFYFARWEIGAIVDGQWVALVTANNGELTSALGQPGD